MVDRNNVKTIAVVAGNIANDFCRDLVESMKNSIPSDGSVNLMILPGEVLIMDEKKEARWQFDSVFNGIYNLAYQCEPDGIIFAMGSMGWMASESDLNLFFERYKDIPKVLVSSEMQEYITVNYDNETGIKEAIDYLVNVNGFTNICMLGGDSLNPDAEERKKIFIKCLENNGLPFREEFFEPTNMSTHTEVPAQRLLDNNPDVQAVFCVNDTTAKGLYSVMERRGLRPGKDILVFGFDNTRMASEMTPSLSSIGPARETLGQKALELMIDQFEGKEVSSVMVATRLYGRESFQYDVHMYSNRELMAAGEEFIYRLFDDCFYRYNSSSIKRTAVDLRRLYYEFISRILKAYKRKFMPYEEYEEIGNMIDVFFRNGAMEYTDSEKILSCVERLQNALNIIQKSIAVNSLINRLFLRMKDDCIREICKKNVDQRNSAYTDLKRMKDHLICGFNYQNDREKALTSYFKSLDLVCIRNGSLFLFDKPVVKQGREEIVYPDELYMKCFIKDGEIHMTPQDRQLRKTKLLFSAIMEMAHLECMVVFPLVYERYTYGLIFCELTEKTYNMGGFVAINMGMTLKLLEESQI